MQIDTVIIGLTGSFGSGCSTLRKVLEKNYGFKGFKLSEEVRLEANSKGIKDPKRDHLQTIANELRRDKGNSYLARKAIEKIEKSEGSRYVIHGFRHSAEVQEFRRYPNFFLVAVDASKDIRWERLKEFYKGNQADFEKDDKRDKDEGLSYGQQVLRCVEQADIIFLNENQYPTSLSVEDKIRDRFDEYLGLVTGEKIRQPTLEETMMTLASSLALQSSCIKRRVGAVLCNKRGFIVSAAYNEIPNKEGSCIDVYSMCYRDFFRDNFKRETLKNFQRCPLCGKTIVITDSLKSNNTVCSSCKGELFSLFPTNFKALDKCRALHAEETVLLQTPGSESEGAILYTTTFPCMQCAKRIVHAKIKAVNYIDPYPEPEAVEIIRKGDVIPDKFEGVKAQVFYRLYHRRRELTEREVEKRRKV